MKWSLLSIILLSYLCIACSQEASHQPTSNQKTSNQETSSQKTTTPQYSLFIATLHNIIIQSDLMQLDAQFGAQLFLHQNCLSIKILNDSKKELTYVLAQHETPIFNAQKQLIGIENKKTQQKYALGEEVMLDGLHTATTTQNPKHPLPPQCFQNVYIGGNILKQ